MRSERFFPQDFGAIERGRNTGMRKRGKAERKRKRKRMGVLER